MRGDYAAVVYATLLVGLYSASAYAGVPRPFFLSATVAGIHALSALFVTAAYRLSPWHPLASYPGPWLWRISSLRLVYVSFMGKRHLILDELHQQYGPFVRIGKQENTRAVLLSTHIKISVRSQPAICEQKLRQHNNLWCWDAYGERRIVQYTRPSGRHRIVFQTKNTGYPCRPQANLVQGIYRHCVSDLSHVLSSSQAYCVFGFKYYELYTRS